MAEIVVVGGGVAGLGAAVTLSRRGHKVTLLERDATPLPASADEAFDWDRRGAPQVRQSHAFLARLCLLLRDQYPDVLQALLDEGAEELRFGDALPPTLQGYEPQPDDVDLTILALRRTTYEWVLRRAALASPGVTLRDGIVVEGLVATGASPPRVTGVRCADGSTIDADIVVVATGRRTALPAWLEAIGTPPVTEQADECGIVYYSRFYRLRPGHELPPRVGPMGGDMGYLKYGVFLGDHRTFSITLATPTEDDLLRRLLADDKVFDDTCRLLTGTAAYLDGRAEPISPAAVMAGLVNRWRDYVPDGAPLALGVHALGDAWLCTNPLYGRGCTTGFWQAHLLAEAIDAHPADLTAQAVALDAATREHLYPWYRASVEQDIEAKRVASAILAGEDPDGDTSDPRTFVRAILRQGLLPALRYDAVVLRAFLRNLNLLSAPDALMTDPEIGARVLAVYEARDQRGPEPILGPDRPTLLQVLEAAAA
ncbi:MAG TPA: FAD-dependent oxidoreductase [Acidimicrobiales bacterium]